MKKLGKPIFVILALLILVFSVLSVSGYSYYTGDIKHTVFKGFGSLDWGNDVTGGTKIAVKPASADEADNVKSVIKERAAYFGLTDYQLYTDGNKDIILVVPDSINADMDATEIASFLTSNGEFTLRPGNSYKSMHVDSSGNAAFTTPQDKTALLTSNNVKNASMSKYTESGYTYNFVDVTFDSEGTDVLKQLTNPDTGAYYNQIISAWLDDRMLGYQTMSNQVTTGVFSFTNDGMTKSNAQLFSSVIKAGEMPCDVLISYFSETEPVAGANASDIICYTGLISLLTIAVITLYKYKVGGVVTLLAVFAEFAGLLSILTGFVGEGHTFLLTIPGAGAMALSVVLTVLSCILICEKTRRELLIGTELSTAFDSAYKDNKNKVIDITFVLALISLMGLFVFGKSTLTVSLFGKAVASGIYNFSYVLFFGAVLNFICGYVLPKLMFRSILSFKSFAKASMFGGADNDK